LYAQRDDAARSVCREAAAFGVKAEAYRWRRGGLCAAKETVKRIVTDFGSVDILVNCAGITRDALICSMNEEPSTGCWI
jgi:3-oxoacyl-[acyl-carrier protein] reductase